ncbi:ATP-dependent Clp protease ATP-binding subunit [Candidatus Neomarinimicrobiota bacterium]
MDQSQSQSNPENGVNALEAYGINLTGLALESKIDPVIGREDEIRRIIQILSRRTKNNPVLIGEPGTGKTTVVEGLAKRIVEGDVPENLKGKQLILLDLTAMVAGAMYRGQFEERLKNFIKEVIDKEGEIIVFIDELHTIVGAGAAAGSLDVSNIIKPELARGRMKVIGATTLNEYKKYIETDAALERRFQHVIIAEPDVETTITILRGIKDRYELHHGLRIKDTALVVAATLSERYISDRFLPDKAVDLVDEAAAKLRMEINSAPEEIDNLRRKLVQLEVELAALGMEKDAKSRDQMTVVKQNIKQLKEELAANERIWEREKDEVLTLQTLKNKLDELHNEWEQSKRDSDYQKAAKLQYQDIPSLEKQIDDLTEKLNTNSYIKLEVGAEDIAEVVARWTGIPVLKMMEGEKEKLLSLESLLRKRVVGQEAALKLTCDVIRMSKMGVLDADRPIGSFLFMGNTGVGKTELAKTIAEGLFDSEKALVRLDMSEYMEQHSVAKLIGSPPGYVGYDEGGQLTETIRRRPYAVILFDEIEKAHPSVLNMLLQVLDDGRLTDSKGRTVNFKNTIIIMTSNLEQSELKIAMRPEFINRIDEIITFNDLDADIISQIIDIHLAQLRKILASQNVTVEIDPSIKKYLAEQGYQPEYGARPIGRLMKRELLAAVSRFLLENPETRKIRLRRGAEQIIVE